MFGLANFGYFQVLTHTHTHTHVFTEVSTSENCKWIYVQHFNVMILCIKLINYELNATTNIRET